MRARRVKVCLLVLALLSLTPTVSWATLIYNFGYQWDFTDNVSFTTGSDSLGSLVWQYEGGPSTALPSAATSLTWDSVNHLWVGSGTNSGSIGDGVIMATFPSVPAPQPVMFLTWIAPVSGTFEIAIDLTGANKRYQAQVFSGDYNEVPDGLHTGSSSDFSYVVTKNLSQNETITLKISPDVVLASPTVQTSFVVTYLTQVPEPMTLAFLATGLVSFLARKRK
jgi:hypothetical protein